MMKRRLLSTFLALSMVVSMLPSITLFVAATDTTTTASGILDQDAYDTLGLGAADLNTEADDSAAPYNTETTVASWVGREIYVAAKGALTDEYTVRAGFNRMNSSNDGDTYGAAAYYGVSNSISKVGDDYGGGTSSGITSNYSETLASGDNGFTGIYATSTAFNAGEGQENYIAELRAYGTTGGTTSEANQIVRLFIYKIDSNGNRIEMTSTSNYTVDTGNYFSRRFVQELDGIFEVEAADIDGDGIDEIFVYAGKYYDEDGIRYAQVQSFTYTASGGSLVAREKIAVNAGTASSYYNNQYDHWYWKILDFPIVTIAAGDIDMDFKDEVAITVSAPNLHSDADDAAQTTVYEYVESSGNSKLVTPISDLNEIYLGNWASANCTFGSFVNTDTNTVNALIVAGYADGDGYLAPSYSDMVYKIIYFDTTTGSYSISDQMVQNMAEGSTAKIIIDSCVEADGYTVSGGGYTTDKKDNKYFAAVPAPIPLAAANMGGTTTAGEDYQVFLGGDVYEFSLSGITDPTAIASASVANDKEVQNQSGTKKTVDKIWISDVTVGSVDTDCVTGHNMRESFVYITGSHNDSYTNESGEDYNWLSIGVVWKDANTSSDSYGTAREMVVNDSACRHDQWGAFVSLALPDIDDNDTYWMIYDESYTIYTNPEVYAVLQASPYFEDLAEVYDYPGDGVTGYGASSGSAWSAGASFSASAGYYASLQLDLIVSVDFEVEAGITTSSSYMYSKETEFSTAFDAGAGSDDMAVVYTVPVTYHVYDVYSPATKTWSQQIFSTIGDEVVALIDVTTYDEVANSVDELDPIRGNLINTTPGDPSTYENQTIAGEVAYKGSGSNVQSAAQSGGTTTKEVSVTSNNEFEASLGASLNLKYGGGVGVAGNSATVGKSYSIEASVIGGYALSSGTTFTAAVDNLPIEATDYSFDWNLVVNSAELNNGDVWIVGYNVENVVEPPRMPQNLGISEITSNSITLEWEAATGAYTYVIYAIDGTGNYNKVGTTLYTQTEFEHTGLMANTSYTYVVRGVSADGKYSIYSPEVSASTLNEGTSFEISKQPQDSTVAAGMSATFTIEASVSSSISNINTSLTYSWQQYDDASDSWITLSDSTPNGISGVDTASLTISDVSSSHEGNEYRCRVYSSAANASVYSTSATLSVGKVSSTVTMGMTNDDGTVNLTTGEAIISASGQYSYEEKVGEETIYTGVTLESGEEGDDGYAFYKLVYDTTSETFYWLSGGTYYAYDGDTISVTVIYSDIADTDTEEKIIDYYSIGETEVTLADVGAVVATAEINPTFTATTADDEDGTISEIAFILTSEATEDTSKTYTVTDDDDVDGSETYTSVQYWDAKDADGNVYRIYELSYTDSDDDTSTTYRYTTFETPDAVYSVDGNEFSTTGATSSAEFTETETYTSTKYYTGSYETAGTYYMLETKNTSDETRYYYSLNLDGSPVWTYYGETFDTSNFTYEGITVTFEGGTKADTTFTDTITTATYTATTEYAATDSSNYTLYKCSDDTWLYSSDGTTFTVLDSELSSSTGTDVESDLSDTGVEYSSTTAIGDNATSGFVSVVSSETYDLYETKYCDADTDTVQLWAKVADYQGVTATGTVYFVFDGPYSGTVTATYNSTTGQYEADWQPSMEGLYTIYAYYGGDDTFNAGASTTGSFYAVMSFDEAEVNVDHTAITLSVPSSMTYGNTASLTVTASTADNTSSTITDVSTDNGVTYTVLIQETVDGTTSNRTATGAEYTIENGVFTPLTTGNFTITAMYDGAYSTSCIITVNKATLTLSAQDMEAALNDTNRSVTATISGYASWDETEVTALSVTANDYRVYSTGETTSTTGEYTITASWYANSSYDADLAATSYSKSDNALALEDRYSLVTTAGTYTLVDNAYDVSASADNNGSISVQYSYVTDAGVTMTMDMSNNTSLPEGATVTFTAAPNAGYVVSKWTVNDTVITTDNGSNFDTSGTYTIDDLSEDTTVKVEFAQGSNTLVFNSDNNSYGSVTGVYLDSTSATVASGANVNYNHEILLTATPADNYTVDYWTVQYGSEEATIIVAADGESNYTGTTYELSKINSNVVVTVYFTEKATFDITINPVDANDNALSNATIYVNSTLLSERVDVTPDDDDDETAYVYEAYTGENIVIVVTPPSGLLIDTWTVEEGQAEGTLTSNNTTMTMYDLQAATDYTVTITGLNTYGVYFSGKMEDGTAISDSAGTVTAVQTGYGSLENGATPTQGSTIVFTATAQPGYEIIGWTLNGSTVTGTYVNERTQTYQVSNLDGDGATAVVTFRQKPVVNIDFYSDGTIVVTGTVNGVADTVVADGGYVDFESDISVVLTPDKGYEVDLTNDTTDFTTVTTSDVMSYSIENVDDDVTISHSFAEIPTTTLTYSIIDKNDTEEGGLDGTLTVTIDRKSMADYEVEDADTGSETVYRDSDITFTATPADGYKIGKWIVNGTEQLDTPSYTDLQDMADLTIQVQFDQRGDKIYYELTGEDVGASITAINGLDQSNFESGSAITADATITFTLSTLPEGYSVDYWAIDSVAQDNTAGKTVFNYDATFEYGVTVTAHIIRDSYEVSFSGTNGAVTAKVDGTSITSGDAIVGDSSVTFTVVPTAGYEFSHWTVNSERDTETSTELTIDITKAVTVEAISTLVTHLYTVTYSAGEHGELTATVETGAEIAADTDVTFTANPADGYQVAGWTVDGDAMADSSELLTYTHTVVDDLDVVVAFEEIPSYDITFATNGAGVGTLTAQVNDEDVDITSGTISVKRHDKLVVTGTANDYNYLSAWSVTGTEGTTDGIIYTIDDVLEATTITATFDPAQMAKLTANVVNSNGTLSTVAGYTTETMSTIAPATGVNVYLGQIVELTAAPADGYMVKEWIVNGVVQDNLSNTLTIDSFSGETTITVEFEALTLWNIPSTSTDYEVSDAVFTPDDYSSTQVRDRGDVTFTITPDSDKYLSKLEINGINLVTTASDDIVLEGTENVTAMSYVMDGTSYVITLEGVTANVVATIEAHYFQVITENLAEEYTYYDTEGVLQTVTSAAVESELTTEIKAAIGTATAVISQEVKLQISSDGIKWVDATTDNFPAEGITITLDLPSALDGKTRAQLSTSNYDFAVVHYIVSAINDAVPGTTETFSIDDGTMSLVVKDDYNVGLQMTVYSLSPFAVAYKYSSGTVDTGGSTGGTTTSGGGGGGSSSSSDDDEEEVVVETDTHLSFVNGYTDGTFAPDGNLTRAEALTIFANLMDPAMDTDETYANTFSDVDATLWYANIVGFMEDYNIITGYTDGTFGGGNTITRAEFAVIATRFGDLEQADEDTDFTDVNGHWAVGYIAAAVEAGWISGYSDGTFKPDQTITRAEAVTIINRMLGRAADQDFVDDNADEANPFSDVSSTHWAYYQIIEAAVSHTYSLEDDAEVWTEIN